MKSGYKVEWTDNALNELKEVFEYLELKWTERESKKLSQKIETTVKLIAENPSLFPQSKHLEVRKAVVHKLNTIYYRENNNNKTVQILSFFSNRKNPNKLKV
ncbi:type II toxin-antitoxin system RelE/ParE family toxin [Wenyingzhuangia aestuarii]|uniref:type II toxin-antitoxin system RelE/ParE family toxin n=1 Tax=Wenyingzhuangia aestuarii TaxID=1647582 RepID=UPI001439E4F5|nr:type II toxin-antitoxin system RelE/ParE family toxin [Wenyingzhuangia aestuarii]NJB81926.1 plasmid stabilization system protein ParE [Wenyingzhuangia aestuarii]